MNGITGSRTGPGPVLSAVLRATYNGIVTVDRAGRITLFNPAAERLLGISSKIALGRPIQEVIPATGLPAVLKSGEPQLGSRLSFGGRMFISNRTPIWQDGKLAGAVAVFHDVSELESVSAELGSTRLLLQQLDAVIESSGDGIYITDGSGMTLRVNRAYEEITGLNAREVTGRSMQELVGQGVFSESVTLLVLERRTSATIMQRIRNGRHVLVTGNPVFDEHGHITMVVTNVRDITRLSALQQELSESRALKERYQEQLRDLTMSGLGEIVTVSESMQAVLRLAAQVAPYPTAILLQGESGVGKEVVAGFIHRHSRREDGPFIRINCGAIPEQLLESELFGYEGGAFTGARKEGKPGLFELAHRGTLLLDEIDSLPLTLQVKMLRVLQEQEVMRVGASQTRKVDVRVISCTNKDLEQWAQDGRFRQDLFYRLHVVRLVVPPLRERPEDIPVLVEAFLGYFHREYGVPKALAPETLACLRQYPWPGNIRELKNLIEYLVVSVPEPIIRPEHLPGRLLDSAAPVRGLPPFREAVAQLERQLVQRALREHPSLRQAARALGLDHATFLRKVKRYAVTAAKGESMA